jgi:hypothetical protein
MGRVGADGDRVWIRAVVHTPEHTGHNPIGVGGTSHVLDAFDRVADARRAIGGQR